MSLRGALPNVPAGGPRERRGVEPEVLVGAAPAENSPLAPAFGSPTEFQGCANVSPMPAMSAPSVTHSGVPGAHERRAGDLPAAEHRAHHAGLIAIERQVVDVIEVEHVAAVEARVAPEARVVVVVEQHVALAARVVLRVAERVGGAELEAVLVAAIGAELQAVVLRVARVLDQPDDAVALVGPQRGDVDRRDSPAPCRPAAG